MGLYNIFISMNPILIIAFIFFGLLILWIGWGIVSQYIWEQPSYTVLYQSNRIQLRRYSERVAISIQAAPNESAFSTLAGYIFGSNKKQIHIPMTAPVLTQPIGQGQKMVFYAPKKYTMEKLPTPNIPDINFHLEPVQTLALIRFYGLRTQRRITKYSRQLRIFLDTQKILYQEPEFEFQYSDPFVPPFMRKNEIGVVCDENSLNLQVKM